MHAAFIDSNKIERPVHRIVDHFCRPVQELSPSCRFGSLLIRICSDPAQAVNFVKQYIILTLQVLVNRPEVKVGLQSAEPVIYITFNGSGKTVKARTLKMIVPDHKKKRKYLQQEKEDKEMIPDNQL